MRTGSKGMSYTRRGAGVCSLRSGEGCRDTEIIIPQQVLFKGKVTEIDNYAFRNHAQIKRVVIPEGIVAIGEYAFENCKNLEYIVLPQSLKSIGRGAFMHCEKLKSIELPTSLSSIPMEAFACCYSLERIDLSHIRSLGKYAFAKCDALREMIIGDGIEEMDATTFRESGYDQHRANWKDGLLYLGKWVIGCNGSTDEYIVRSDTVGIASNVFAGQWHVKRTKNPEYEDAMIMFDTAMVCFNAPMPDLSRIPEYFEEIIPAKIQYEGTTEAWSKIVKLCGDQRIPALIKTKDGTVDTKL